MDGSPEVRFIVILLAATLIVSMAYNFDFGVWCSPLETLPMEMHI